MGEWEDYVERSGTHVVKLTRRAKYVLVVQLHERSGSYCTKADCKDSRRNLGNVRVTVSKVKDGKIEVMNTGNKLLLFHVDTLPPTLTHSVTSFHDFFESLAGMKVDYFRRLVTGLRECGIDENLACSQIASRFYEVYARTLLTGLDSVLDHHPLCVLAMKITHMKALMRSTEFVVLPAYS